MLTRGKDLDPESKKLEMKVLGNREDKSASLYSPLNRLITIKLQSTLLDLKERRILIRKRKMAK